MRKFLLVVLVLAAIHNWEKITGVFDSSPQPVSNGGHQVILYATQWCGYCAKARTLFQSNSIPYLEYDIEKSSEGRKQYDALGGRGVPLMVINGSLIKGYSERHILTALQNQGGH